MVYKLKNDIFEWKSDEVIPHIRNQFMEIRKSALEVVNQTIKNINSEKEYNLQNINEYNTEKNNEEAFNAKNDLSMLLNYLKDSNNRLSQYDIKNIKLKKFECK
ncbi:hypothetical protein FG386_003106 [Cryptosporidium ryanae]|uniref:uncharacterized protein n=1 Tax=Cryptosporidium ryanae TaxID=515981 RepID=UPI00351A4B81|nr:hypothetical protein FG386_003106 [Cryptosporidium ryanae]